MDLNIIIMSAVIIALCVIPMFVISKKQKQKKARSINLLNEIAKSKSGEIVSSEVCGQLAVGITANDEAFVFYNIHENGKEEKHCLLFSEVKQCNMIQVNRKSSNGSIGKLNLSFDFVDKSKSPLSIVFFDSDESFQLAGELQLLEKWKPIIDKAIDSQKSLRQPITKKAMPASMAV